METCFGWVEPRKRPGPSRLVDGLDEPPRGYVQSKRRRSGAVVLAQVLADNSSRRGAGNNG